MARKTKLVFLDIENTPNLAYVWGHYEQDVIGYEREWNTLSFAYCWEGGSTKVKALPDFKNYKKDKFDDSELIGELWKILDEADIVVGHNIDRFDIRKINARFLKHGLTLPSPFKTVDTLKVAKKMFFLNSNKLDHIAVHLGVGRKVDTGGFDLWLRCMKGDAGAWKLMKAYNKHDVDLTRDVYYRLLPFVTNHPNRNLLENTTHSCPNCGSYHNQKRGFDITKVAKYQKHQCIDCGSWYRGEKVNDYKVVAR